MSYAIARAKVLNKIVIADNIPFSHAAKWKANCDTQKEIAEASDPHMRIIMNAIIDYFSNINGVACFGEYPFKRVFEGKWFDNERYQIHTTNVAHPQKEAMMGMNEEEISKLNVTFYNICGLIMNREIIPTVASWLTFFQHPRMTLAYQQERGRQLGLKYGRQAGLKCKLKGLGTKRNNFRTKLRERIGVEADAITCLDLFDSWCSKNITSDMEKELMTRYVRPDNEVSCVYIACLSILHGTLLLTYLDIILQSTHIVENTSKTACVDELFEYLECKYCHLLVNSTQEINSIHGYRKHMMIHHATSCKAILGMQESSVVKCQGCKKTLLEIQNENNYTDLRLLRGWILHSRNCDGTHYDKVYEAYKAVFSDTVNKRGHINKETQTWVTMDVVERIMIGGEWTNEITLNDKLCLALYNYVSRLRSRDV